MWHFKGFDFLSVTILPIINFYISFCRKKYSALFSLHLDWDATDLQKQLVSKPLQAPSPLQQFSLQLPRFFIKRQKQCLSWGIIEIPAGQKIQELLIASEKEKKPFARSHKQLALVNKSKAGMWWQKERFTGQGPHPTGQGPHRTGGFAPEHQELLCSQFDRNNTLRMVPKADRWFSQHPGMNLHSADFNEWKALELQWCIMGIFWVYKLYICCVLAACLDIWGQLWSESTAPCCCSLPSIPGTCQMDSAAGLTQGWDLQGERWISAHGN